MNESINQSLNQSINQEKIFVQCLPQGMTEALNNV